VAADALIAGCYLAGTNTRRVRRALARPRKATAISLLVAVGVRTDGQKVLLAVKAMGGESAEAGQRAAIGEGERRLIQCRRCEVRNSGEPHIDLDHRLAPARTSPGWGFSCGLSSACH
jgi:hypothetical protein